MVRRPGETGGDNGATPDPRYLRLRSKVLELDPATLGISPSRELPRVFAFVMDRSIGTGVATTVTLADGTTSMYTSTGGGVIGGGFHEFVVRANRQLLLSAESNLDQLVDRGEPTLPPNGLVRLTAVTYDGLRSVAAAPEDLGRWPHPASPLFRCANQIVTELRKMHEATRDKTTRVASAEDSLTRLAKAARGRDRRLIAHLLELGDEVDERSPYGYTALMFAAAAPDLEVVAMLLEHGADPNAATDVGATALMNAAQADRKAAIALLLSAGADPTATDAKGRTALAYAEQAGHMESAALLRP